MPSGTPNDRLVREMVGAVAPSAEGVDRPHRGGGGAICKFLRTKLANLKKAPCVFAYAGARFKGDFGSKSKFAFNRLSQA